MYKTKEEVEQAWPLGTVVSEEPIYQRFYCADPLTLEKLKKWFVGADVKQTSPHHATVTRIIPHIIEGYLYNGDEWAPMTKDSMGWSIYVPDEF